MMGDYTSLRRFSLEDAYNSRTLRLVDVCTAILSSFLYLFLSLQALVVVVAVMECNVHIWHSGDGCILVFLLQHLVK